MKKTTTSPSSRISIATVTGALLAAVAWPLAAQDTALDCALRIGGGPKGKIYELMVQDIQKVCGAEVSVCSVPSIGGLPNLMMLAASQVELGIVQLDTLTQMANGGDENIAALQAVMPLHTNLLHILSLRAGSRVDILRYFFTNIPIPWTGNVKVFGKFSDLKGVKVAVVGSTQLLGQTLNQQTGYAMEFLMAESDDQAVRMLQTNQVQAIFTDGGWPLPSISRHQTDSGLMLVEYDLPIKEPFIAIKRNYENLDAFNFNFLGIPNLLVTRPFRNNGDSGKRVATLQRCLLNHLDELQEGRFQAGWKEIKKPMDTLGVARFGANTTQKTASH
jgi:TRAP-type uncharacterized transport system substrate-binding protein